MEHNLITKGQLAAALPHFHGVRRRLELKTSKSIIPVYEDFGSSYAKAKAGIETIRQYYPDKKVLVVFEPHTFSFRNREALQWYNDLFTSADLVYIMQPPLHGAATHGQLSLEEIVEQVKQSGVRVQGVHTRNQLLSGLTNQIDDQSVILIETSGGLQGAIPQIVSYAEQHFPK